MYKSQEPAEKDNNYRFVSHWQLVLRSLFT